MIENIFNYSNVYYINNGCPFEKLNEKKFLRNFFGSVEAQFSQFREYNFYLVSGNYENACVTTPPLSNILIFISDELGTEVDFSESFLHVFKSYGGGDSPFPLGYVGDIPELPYKPIAERKYDCFFSGNLNANRFGLWANLIGLGRVKIHPKLIINKYTKKIVFGIKSLHDFSNKFATNSIIRFNNGFKAGLSPDEYGRILSESRIVLNPKGFHSPECFRCYEAMRAGCVVISEKLPNNYLYADSPIIQVENWRGINKLIKNLLSDPIRMQSLSEQSLEWYRTRLSETATAERIIQAINNDKHD